ncbi:MAG: hypothetical protein ON057_000014 [Glomeribacter sp. 1016415]|nr:hypothetical protein [Glomeribacter sp. 1016415]
MNKLDLKIIELDSSEYIDTPYENEVYANISLDILLDRDRVFNLFKIKWDAICLLEWVIENKQAILTESPPSFIKGYVSLACGVSNFYETVDVDNLKDLNLMFKYRTRHGLRFSLRGVDIDEIYIGMSNEDYEISYWGDNSNWSYKIDLPNFIGSVENYYFSLKNK